MRRCGCLVMGPCALLWVEIPVGTASSSDTIPSRILDLLLKGNPTMPYRVGPPLRWCLFLRSLRGNPYTPLAPGTFRSAPP